MAKFNAKAFLRTHSIASITTLTDAEGNKSRLNGHLEAYTPDAVAQLVKESVGKDESLPVTSRAEIGSGKATERFFLGQSKAAAFWKNTLSTQTETEETAPAPTENGRLTGATK